MRDKFSMAVERCRVLRGTFGTEPFCTYGVFFLPVGKVTLKVIVGDMGSWDHVSVSLVNRIPTWEEMCAVKEAFFRDDETVVQFHPPKHLHISDHDYCLHLWRDQKNGHALPPSWMVSVRGEEDAAQCEAALDALEAEGKAKT